VLPHLLIAPCNIALVSKAVPAQSSETDVALLIEKDERHARGHFWGQLAARRLLHRINTRSEKGYIRGRGGIGLCSDQRPRFRVINGHAGGVEPAERIVHHVLSGTSSLRRNYGLTGRNRLVHQPPRIRRERVAVVHGATIVPNEQIADLPIMLPYILVLACVRPHRFE
jgi:hypothetical protein